VKSAISSVANPDYGSHLEAKVQSEVKSEHIMTIMVLEHKKAEHTINTLFIRRGEGDTT